MLKWLELNKYLIWVTKMAETNGILPILKTIINIQKIHSV